MYGTLISGSDLKKLIDTKAPVVIVDCRFSLANAEWGRSQYAEGHIPGAVYAHLNEDLSAPVVQGKTGRHPLPEKENFIAWLEQNGISNDTQVIAYDQANGSTAARLWWLLRWAGHDAVAVLDGGWQNWIKENGDQEVVPRKNQPQKFTPQFRDQLIAEADDIALMCTREKCAVVDSRDTRRFEGIEEPIDPVAGHIPGAMNLPFAQNTDSDGKWKSAEELKKRFASLVERCGCSNIAFYCGSGVTASQNILAVCHAGLGDVKLYPGSWSEWITDQTRGVEVNG
jgi:thiosulfate/3-mercaptopyruvate sulfurtransferase